MEEDDLFENYVENEETLEEENLRKNIDTEHEKRMFRSVILNKNTVDLLMKVDPFRTLSDLVVMVINKQKNSIPDVSILQKYLKEMPPKHYTTSIREDAHRALLMVKRSNGFKTMAITLDALAVVYLAQKCRESRFHNICYSIATPKY